VVIAGSDRSGTEAVTCLGCGCLCDDLTIAVEEDRIVSVGAGCDLGLRWFSSGRDEQDRSAWIEGRGSEFSEATDRAAELLRNSRAPLFFGLTKTSIETVREVLALAEMVGARVWLDRSAADLGRVVAFSQGGRVTATLGEVKNRADVVVFVGADPVTTHPRHWERYSVASRGRFIWSREARDVIVVDSERTPSADQADLFLACSAEYEYEWLSALRALVRDKSIDTSTFTSQTGIGRLQLDELVSRLGSAHYGAIFYQSRHKSAGMAAACWEGVADLVRALNEDSRRFVLLGMGTGDNLAGAEALLTWQTGYAQNVDFRLGFPTPLDEYTGVEEMIRHRDIDLILVLGNELPTGLNHASTLNKIPIVAIAPWARAMATPVPSVAITTATTGIDSGGTVMRSDGVVLTLRPPLRSRHPTEVDCLQALAGRLGVAVGSKS
jgi:formylmethanofuran dehydrogenase subunit B